MPMAGRRALGSGPVREHERHLIAIFLAARSCLSFVKGTSG